MFLNIGKNKATCHLFSFSILFLVGKPRKVLYISNYSLTLTEEITLLSVNKSVLVKGKGSFTAIENKLLIICPTTPMRASSEN